MFYRRAEGDPVEVADERQYARIQMILGLVCRQKGQDFNIFTDDVSLNGIRFISQHPVASDEDLVLLVTLDNKQLAIKGRPAWVREEGSHQFVGGIAFQQMGDAEREQWNTFIERNRTRSAAT